MIKVTKLLSYDSLFWLLLLVAIAPIWVFTDFLTCDGPCHLVNANVLKEFWWGNSDFYSQYYELNRQTAPNWLSHVLLAIFSVVFNPVAAGKLVITICVVNFAAGFRYLIYSFSAQQKGLAIFGLLFVWQIAMYMGFYNYMLSLGLFFFIAGYWLRRGAKLSVKETVVLAAGTVVLYFAHLMGLFFLLLMLGVMFVLMLADKRLENKAATIRRFVVHAFLSVLPALLLTINYISRTYQKTDNIDKEPINELLWKLRDAFTLQSLALEEYEVARAVVKVVAVLLLISLFFLFRKKQNKQWLIMLVFLLFILGYYFMGYESLLGGSYIRYRLETLSYVFAVLFAASIKMNKYVQLVAVFVAVALIAIFTVIRYPVYKTIDNIISEYRSLEQFVNDESVVLPVCYERFYTDTTGVGIANKVLLFTHVTNCIAPSKKLVYLDNYEADTRYFPLVWKESVSPYKHLSAGQSWGHELAPPDMDLEKYLNEVTKVDYLVIWGRDKARQDDGRVQQQNELFNRRYEWVYTTPVRGIQLYKLKS